MITVNLDNDDALEMLMERVSHWTDGTTLELFEKMYENQICNGCFDGCEFNVMSIVDNDYVNWCNVIWDNEDEFEELLETYKKGEREYKYYVIEAVSDDETAILVRQY